MIRLQKYKTGGRAAFEAWMRADPAALAFVAKSFPSSAPEPVALFSRFAALDRAASDHLAWAIEDVGGELLGHLELKPTAKVHDGELELVYIVRREARGRGVATTAVRLALAETPIVAASAIVAFINPRNAASQRVVEKVGFLVDAVGDSEFRYRLPLVAGCPTPRFS